MSFTITPKNLLNEEIYKALKSEDVADVVMKWRDLLDHRQDPIKETAKKNEEKSNALRVKGNQFFGGEKYYKALQAYNMAIAYAPKGTRAFINAYSNRSALLLKCQFYKECLIDVETCLSLGCPDDLKEKILYRKRKCDKSQGLIEAQIFNDVLVGVKNNNFFTKDFPRNPQIPCASTSVGVIMNPPAPLPKVVAAKDIPAGTLVALEEAFVINVNDSVEYIACSYCRKMCLNLIPCGKCSDTMFCSESCRELCNTEYHAYECQTFTTNPLLEVRAVLKIRQQCKTWEEFIELSDAAVKGSRSVSETFDRNNPMSALCLDDDSYFKYGFVYVQSLKIAQYLRALEKKTHFFPKNIAKKIAAMKAFARSAMRVAMFSKSVATAEAILGNQCVTQRRFGNRSLFSFISKLKHSCSPNLLTVTFNRETALVAIEPIKRGTELTISYVLHRLQHDSVVRQHELFTDCRVLCDCELCNGTFEHLIDVPLTELQQKAYQKVHRMISQNEFEFPFGQQHIPTISKALASLSDVPYSKEYNKVFVTFIRIIMNIQCAMSDNKVLTIDF